MKKITWKIRKGFLLVVKLPFLLLNCMLVKMYCLYLQQMHHQKMLHKFKWVFVYYTERKRQHVQQQRYVHNSTHKVIKAFYFHRFPTMELMFSWGKELKRDDSLLGRHSKDKDWPRVTVKSLKLPVEGIVQRCVCILLKG